MNILTVSQLNFYVKSLLQEDAHLKNVYLRGEISNLTDHYRSGHIYLTLKDSKCAVKAVMFAGNARSLRFRPEDGMKVLVRGSISLYEVTGSYQFIIEDMMPDGVGAMNLAFEQLKRKLSEEGLFDDAHKKPLPFLPRRIGVITSPTGAAVQDILRILRRRYPLGEIVMCPVQVQGDAAAAQLTEAVKRFNRLRCADVMILGRGGGSAEDLWAFNDEALARAVYASEIPVVSAVGHESDVALCDFVADMRASTPSAAAELVSPEPGVLHELLLQRRRQLRELIRRKLDQEKRRLDTAASARVLRSPQEIVHFRRMKLDLLHGRLRAAGTRAVSDSRTRLATLAGKLDALSPLKVLGRGYAIALKEDRVIAETNAVSEHDDITIVLTDGRLRCTVEEIRRNEQNEST